MSDEPLAKIHCELWGKAPIISVQGFKYYALFVDDFSRFNWLYPLKKKSDFLRCFIAFHKLVEKQIGKSVKIFQSDGSGEFSKKEFFDYLSDHGIAHRLSCLGTPEQNGVAERKHRHIVELGLAMLYQASEPKRFWVEAFATSVFLINRLPSSQLKMGCP